MNDSRNFILAIALSIAVLFGFQYFTSSPPPKSDESTTSQSQQETKKPETKVIPRERDEVLKEGKRIKITSERIKGSINLTGAVIDDVVLRDYNLNLNDESQKIVLLSPNGSHNGYFSAVQWSADAHKSLQLPNSQTVWRADKDELKAGSSVTLSWTNPQKVVFKRLISLDKNFMFDIKDSITLPTSFDENFSVYTTGLISRTGTVGESSFIHHEGAVGVMDGKLKENSYSDLQKENDSFKTHDTRTNSWAGFADKYWVTAVIPKKTGEINWKFSEKSTDDRSAYKVHYVSPSKRISKGETVTFDSSLYAGPKVLKLLDEYEKSHNIEDFDQAVDFGIFYYITKPTFKALTFFNSLLGNFGLSILLLTIIFKLALFPLAR